MSLRNVADTFAALHPAPTDRIRRLAAVLAAPVVKLAAVKPAALRMACFVMVDAAGAVVRFFVLLHGAVPILHAPRPCTTEQCQPLPHDARRHGGS